MAMTITVDFSDLEVVMNHYAKITLEMKTLIEENERLKDQTGELEGEIESLKGDCEYYQTRIGDLRNDLNNALDTIDGMRKDGREVVRQSSSSLMLCQFLNLLRTDQAKARKVLDILYSDPLVTETSNKINKIKAVRDLVCVGLKEAKEFVEGTSFSTYVSFR